MVSAPLLAQSPTSFLVGHSCYRPEGMEATVHIVNGWIPMEWQWQRSLGNHQIAVDCGILGGNHVGFIHYYADLAIQFVEHPDNQLAWTSLSPDIERNLLFEQYLLGCCIEYHCRQPSSPFKDIQIQYLFPSFDYALIHENSAQAGFTHLIADAKRNGAIAHRLESRVRQDYPEYYERCIKYASR